MILGVLWAVRQKLLPEAIILLARDCPGKHLVVVATRLHMRAWVGFEIPVPGWILGLAIVGCADDHILAIAHIEQGMRARLTGFPPYCLQQEHGVFQLLAADLPPVA